MYKFTTDTGELVLVRSTPCNCGYECDDTIWEPIATIDTKNARALIVQLDEWLNPPLFG